jgi:phosphoglycolate phosphatase-like HAD superfamily hydrolase
MLLQAAKDHHFDIRKAIFVGDYITDHEAGVAAGCKTILLSPGQTLLGAVESILAGERFLGSIT